MAKQYDELELTLFPEEFADLEVEECDARYCDKPVAYGANMNLGGETKLCEGHYEKWARAYDQRPRHHIEQPKYLSYAVYFAEVVELP